MFPPRDVNGTSAPGTNGVPPPPPPEKEAALPLIRVGDIPDPGPIKWLVENLWTAGAFGIVGAEPKSWKSWTTLQIAICVAAGRAVFKRFAVEKGPVLVFSAEGGKNLVRSRAAAICRALEIDINALDLEVIDLPSLQIDSADHVKVLHEVVGARRPLLTVLDPLREMHGGDENDAAAIAQLLLPLRLLQRKFDCAVMLVHHMGKLGADSSARRPGQRLRGSSALHGAVDSALYLEPRGEGEAKRVKVIAEHRAAAEPEPLLLRLRTAQRPEGEAAWLEPVDASEDDSAQIVASESVRAYQRDRRRIVEVVRAAQTPGRDPIKTKNAIVLAAGMKRTRALELIDELLADRTITQGEDGVFRVTTG
jgi:hypothetical protein